MFRKYPFDLVCLQNGVEHRLTKPNHPWTNGQVKQINFTIKESTVNSYFYQNTEQLERHLDTFTCAYNFAKHLKTINGLSSYQFIVKSWAENPLPFLFNPSLLNSGLYNRLLALVLQEVYCV
jgi:transposase InsO family protein